MRSSPFDATMTRRLIACMGRALITRVSALRQVGLLTDLTLVAESAVWLVRGMASSSERRPAAMAIIRCNVGIMALNPLRFQVSK